MSQVDVSTSTAQMVFGLALTMSPIFVVH